MIRLCTCGHDQFHHHKGWKECQDLCSCHKFTEKPTIVCLCGSTRFYDAFQEANYRETMAGKIVLTVGFYPGRGEHGELIGITPKEKAMLDELYLRKIDLADEVLVLNVGGYIGESTANEVALALAHGKRVRYLEGGA